MHEALYWYRRIDTIGLWLNGGNASTPASYQQYLSHGPVENPPRQMVSISSIPTTAVSTANGSMVIVPFGPSDLDAVQHPSENPEGDAYDYDDEEADYDPYDDEADYADTGSGGLGH